MPPSPSLPAVEAADATPTGSSSGPLPWLCGAIGALSLTEGLLQMQAGTNSLMAVLLPHFIGPGLVVAGAAFLVLGFLLLLDRP